MSDQLHWLTGFCGSLLPPYRCCTSLTQDQTWSWNQRYPNSLWNWTFRQSPFILYLVKWNLRYCPLCFLFLFLFPPPPPPSLFWFVLSLFYILPLFNCDLDVCYSGALHLGLRCRQCSWLVDRPLMKFRQRIAWLAVILYLTASFGFVYYIFEINDHFNSFALDHVRTYHNGNRAFVVLSLWHHATDIPLAIWLIIFLLPYLQIFGMLLAWTRVEPWRSTAFQWPGIVFNKWRKLYKRLTGHPHHGSKAINSTVAFNGHVVIDTWWRVLLSSVSVMWVW